jgi:hypothetical protein
MFKIYWKHFKVIIKHKWYVFKECFKHGLYWQGIMHDLSKFSITEFSESAKYFQGNKSPITASKEKNGYSYAWLNHKAKNKHHWDYWVDFVKGLPVAVNMPDKYIKEMACDMIGASKAYKNGQPLEYFYKNSYRWIMKKEDKLKLEAYLKEWSKE